MKFLLIPCLLFSGGAGECLYAQKQGQPLIDSLRQELPKAKDDTNKVNMENAVSLAYCYIDPDEGIKYAQQELELATRLDWKKGIAMANNCLGGNYQSKSDFTKALEYYQAALKTDEEIIYKKGVGQVTTNIGNIYSMQSDYIRALEYYFKSLKVNEEIGYKKGIANTNANIGNVYTSQKDYNKASEYYFKALEVYEETGNKIGISSTTGNIGNVYHQLKNYDKALDYFFRQIKVAGEIESKSVMEIGIGNIGNVYADQKNYAEALDYFQQSLKMAGEIGDKYGIATNLDNIGKCFLSIVKDTPVRSMTKVANINEPTRGMYTPSRQAIPTSKVALLRSAIDYLNRCVAVCKEINTIDLMENCYENLAEAYKLTGDYKSSLAAADNYHAIKDSVFSKENGEKIIKMSMQNEYDRQRLADSLKTAAKEKITALQLQRQRSYTIMGIAGILLLIGFSFFIAKERGKSENERKKSDDLLLNILPGEIASELKTNGTTTAKHYDDVTVLFTDFVNFTEAGEKMKPQALIDELHTCFKAFDEITGKHNIEKIKTIGDAYLAVAGLPTADPKHAENAVRAAIEINAFMQDRLAKLGEKTFDIRIGIHSGNVVAGIVGVKKFAYDIWGDTVNTAARMEQNSEPGKINISQTTYELVKDKFACEYRGEIDAKGKGQLKMYFIV